nr:hypothetical protein [Xenorhabdus bovienii]
MNIMNGLTAAKSGLRFTFQIAGLPEAIFAVGEFSLQEGLSELFYPQSDTGSVPAR